MTAPFKPFRNFLRRYDTDSFLRAIWALTNHLEFHRPLPPFLAEAERPGMPFGRPPMLHLWEFDTLAREVILHCQEVGGERVDRWATVRDATNRLRELEEQALIVDGFDVFAELGRIAHRQFHWQSGFNVGALARYQAIYGYPGIDSALRTDFGMGTDDFFLGCFAILSSVMEFPALGPTYIANANPQLGIDIAPIIERFTGTIEEVRQLGMDARSLDEDWAYSFHPLRQFPLLRTRRGPDLLCPIPGLFARRFTDGLYFDLGRGRDVLSRELGPAFQRYVGRVLEASAPGAFSVFAEEPYGTAAKSEDTVDWLVEDEAGVLFVECKVLRLANVARQRMAPLPSIEDQYRKVAKAVGQIYATLTDALAGRYPSWTPGEKPVFPMLVTMDDWNIFTHVAQGDLARLVREDVARRGLDPALPERYPYLIASVAEFESLIQVIAMTDTAAVLEGVSRGPKAGYNLKGYLSSNFPDEVERIVPRFTDETFRRLLAEAKRRTGN